MGVISATTDDVIFDDVFVPEEDRLGEEGKGLARRARHARFGRIGIRRAGRRHRRGRLPLRHATTPHERTTFGKPIAEHQAIAFKLADMQTKIRAARLLVHEAAWMKDRGDARHRGRRPREALRLAGRQRGHLRRRSGPRRARVHEGPARRAPLQGRAGHGDLRGHQRNTTPRDLPRHP